MTKMEKFMSTLNDKEKDIIQRETEKHRDEFEDYTEDALVSQHIFGLSWYYKVFSEYEDTKNAIQMQHRKAELYDKWKALGLLDK